MTPVQATITGDKITLISEFQHRERINQIMGAHHNQVTDQWELPLTWAACTAMYYEFGTEFQTSPELNAWGFEQRNNLVGPALALREQLNLDGIVDKPGDRSTMLSIAARNLGHKVGLFPHQQAGAAFIAVNDGNCGIFDEQGTGKSPQLINGARVLQRSGAADMFPMLIVCPSTVKTHWEREWAKWWPKLTVVKVSGTAVQRKKQLATPAHVYIINFDLLPKHSMQQYMRGGPAMKRCPDCGGFDPKITEAKCDAHPRELNAIKFNSVVVDEAHRITDPHSSWTRAVWANSDKAQHRIAMTGTPIQDTIEDLWPLLRFIAPTEFPVKGKFMDRYAVQNYNHWGAIEVQGVNPLRAAELKAITDHYFRRMLKAVVLPFLPPIMQEIRTVEMTGAQAKAYRDMKKNMMAEVADGKLMITTSPLTKATRLMQLASSYAEMIENTNEPNPLDPNAENTPSVRLLAPSNKINAFMADVKAGDYDGNAGVIVFAQSKQLLDLLSAEMTAKGIDHGKIVGGMTDDARQGDIDRFQAGSVKYILVSITAGGAGLTLTAADTMVYLQRAWSSTAMEQSKARAHRIGSEVHDSIRMVNYLSENTIELHQLEALAGKATRIEEILKDQDALVKFLKEAA